MAKPGPSAALTDDLSQAAAAVQGADISRETQERLAAFWQLALKWNRTVQLFAAGPPGLLWQRHVVDSLQLMPFMAADLPMALDIGSGGGFPGLVLAIATNVPFVLTEPDRRKAAFLREAARVTGTRTTILNSRVEATSVTARLVTARAVGSLTRICGLAVPHLAPDGVCLFLKGAGARAELAEAAQVWIAEWDLLPSRTDPAASIIRVRGLRRRSVADGTSTGPADPCC